MKFEADLVHIGRVLQHIDEYILNFSSCKHLSRNKNIIQARFFVVLGIFVSRIAYLSGQTLPKFVKNFYFILMVEQQLR